MPKASHCLFTILFAVLRLARSPVYYPPERLFSSAKRHTMSTERATFGGGCFWGMEKFYRKEVRKRGDLLSPFSDIPAITLRSPIRSSPH